MLDSKTSANGTFKALAGISELKSFTYLLDTEHFKVR